MSVAFDKKYKELLDEGDGFEDDIDAYTLEIGIVIDNAMKAIEADNKSLIDVLPRNYASLDWIKEY